MTIDLPHKRTQKEKESIFNLMKKKFEDKINDLNSFTVVMDCVCDLFSVDSFVWLKKKRFQQFIAFSRQSILTLTMRLFNGKNWCCFFSKQNCAVLLFGEGVWLYWNKLKVCRSSLSAFFLSMFCQCNTECILFMEFGSDGVVLLSRDSLKKAIFCVFHSKKREASLVSVNISKNFLFDFWVDFSVALSHLFFLRISIFSTFLSILDKQICQNSHRWFNKTSSGS